MHLTILLTFGLGVIILLIFGQKLLCKQKNFPPGPLSLPFIGGIYALGTKPLSNLKKLKLKYGNVIGLDLAGFRGVILNDMNTLRQAFAMPEFQDRPKYEFTYVIRGQNRKGIAWSDGKTHEEQRSFLMKNLKIFGLNRKTMEIILMDQLDHLFNVLDTKLGTPVINQDLFNTIAIGALWTTLSSESAREDDEEFKTVLKLSRKMISSFKTAMCFFPTLSKLFANFSGWNGMVFSSAHMMEFIDKKITEQESLTNLSEEPQNFIHSYIQKMNVTTDPNSSFFREKGKENLMCTMNDLFAAGTESVSTVLTWFLSIIIRHPDKQDKIQKEIDTIIGTRAPTLTDRQILPYVEAFIFELLRFSSAAPLGFPHAASEDVQFQNFFIPKGTVVISNLYNVLRDPEQWPEPDEFKPERFLSNNESSILRNVAKNVDLVFGYGKRLCPGETLAKDELFLIITGLCQRYTFKPDPHCIYPHEIDCTLGGSLVPKPHTLIITKR